MVWLPVTVQPCQHFYVMILMQHSSASLKGKRSVHVCMHILVVYIPVYSYSEHEQAQFFNKLFNFQVKKFAWLANICLKIEFK